MSSEIWDDWAIFARAELASGDADASLRLLRDAYARDKLSREAALWRSLLFLTWAHEGSAEAVWSEVPLPAALNPSRLAALATGVERRGFRGLVGSSAAKRFVDGILARAGGSLSTWLGSLGTGPVGWRAARAEFEAVQGAGPWASWRWADLLARVHGVEISAAELSGAPGPLGAAAVLLDLSKRDAGSSAACADLLARSRAADIPLEGVSQLEAVLGNFSLLLRGLYYVGYAIDVQGNALAEATPHLWRSRDVFPAAYRGRRGVLVPVKKDQLAAYAKRRELINVRA